MKKLIFTICLLFLNFTLYAQEEKIDTTKNKVPLKKLDEVVVTATYMTREADHLVAMPTKEQRKHAMTAFDLLRNLMIPGLSVDRESGNINTPAGSATLYIDGREASFREIRSIRPKDIAKVEYYDLPSGKYSKDAASVNIVMKKLNSGGYTQVDALQGVGYLNGSYNLISKYVAGTKSVNFWAGHSIKDPMCSLDNKEVFGFPSPLNRKTIYNHGGSRSNEEYIQASFSNSGKVMTWMLRSGLSWNKENNYVDNGCISYSSSSENLAMNQENHDRSFRPSIYFYGMNKITKSMTLDYVIDGYYSHNNHNRFYEESANSYSNNVKEDYYYLKANANLSLLFKHNNHLSFNIFEFVRQSNTDYLGLSSYRQNLHSSETLLHADYSQRIGKIFYDINPGLSFLSYRLKGMSSINHVTPRFQFRTAYMINKKQQLQLTFSLGNTYPMITTINNVQQQIDPIIILRGNPEMDNSILLSPRLNYNLRINKITILAGLSYFYQDHAILNDYFTYGSNLISSFRDDAVFHRPGANLSVTYQPSNRFNMNISGEWNRSFVCGSAPHNTLTSSNVSADINYYVGDFAFGATLKSPKRSLINYQIKRKTDWQYQLTALWTKENWGVEVNLNNLFLMKNKIVDELQTAVYEYHSEDFSRTNNQYATIKMVYSLDYGRKTSKSPQYKHVNSESAILR